MWAHRVTVSVTKSWGEPIFKSLFLVFQKLKINPPPSGSCLLQMPSSTLQNLLSCISQDEGNVTGNQGTLYMAQEQEGFFSHLLTVSLWAGFTGGGSISLWAQCSVLLPPSCRWRQAGKEPALRPRAPLFSKQADKKMNPRKALWLLKNEKGATGRCCCFQNKIVKF